MIDKVLIAHIALWIANIFFIISLFPQIFLNYRLKTTKGLSDLMLLCCLNAYLAAVFYAFCLNLPFAYKVMFPVTSFMFFIIIIQRFYYLNKWNKIDKLNFITYVFNFLIAILLISFATKYPNTVGHIAGWVMIILWGIYQIPQVLKNYLEKSTKGFSFYLITLILCGNLIEIFAFFIMPLPLQTLLNAFRSILIYIIFCTQFWLYSKKD